MLIIQQRDSKNENIQKYGCYLSCLYMIANKYIEEQTGKANKYTIKDIDGLFNNFKENEWVDYDCFVKNPVAILNWLTGAKFYIEKSRDPINQPIPSNCFVVGCFEKEEKDAHFVLIDISFQLKAPFENVLSISADPIRGCKYTRPSWLKSLRLFTY